MGSEALGRLIDNEEHWRERAQETRKLTARITWLSAPSSANQADGNACTNRTPV